MAGARIQVKRGTAASWASNNPVLFAGEIGFETDTKKLKFGDGTTAWNSLVYTVLPLSLSSLNDFGDVTITSVAGGDFLRYDSSASVWINDAVNLSTDTIGSYVESLVAGTGVTLSNNSGEGATPTVAIGQDVGTSASVTFGHVSAPVTGNVTGDLIGNANTASTLETARTIEVHGAVSGSVLFDGSEDVEIVTTVVNNSVILGTHTTGDYVSDVVADNTGIVISHTLGEGSSASLSLVQNINTTASVTFAHVNADISGDILGDLTGNADTATTLETARTISLGGDLSGSVSFDGSQDVTITATVEPNSVALGADTTGNYMSDVVAGTGVTVTHTPGEGSSASIAIGQAVGTTDSPSFAGVTADEIRIGVTAAGEIDTTSGNLTIDSAGGTTTLDDDVVITGNLTVSGSATYVNTEVLTIDDNIILLNSNETGAPSQNAGIEVERGTDPNVLLRWNETNGTWELTRNGSTYKDIAIGQDVETSSSVTFAVVSAPVLGNATTATNLLTARAISLGGDLSGSASFDGSADIVITAQVEPNSVALGTDTTGNYVSDVVAGTAISVTHTPGEGSSASIALNAALDDLTDTVITSPEEFQTLEYNGTNWVNTYSPLVSYVRNAEATTLTTGTLVYLFGGNGDHASVKRADNSSDTTSSKTIGVVGASIAASQNGPVITRGYVDGMDLSAYSVGQVLWLGTGGQFTATKPSAPDHLVFVGVVVRATNNGIIYVATQNGYELEELHDVKVISAANGDFLKYNSASAVWVNDQINLGTDTVGDYVQNLVAGTGITLTNNSGEGSTPTVAIGQDVATSASVVFHTIESTHDLTIGGNLYVSGSVITENQTSLAIDDPFIYLNVSSSVSNVDLGIAGNYNDGTYRHAGIFRDATDGKFKFFDSYEPEPSSPIDVAHATYSPAPVVAETFESTVTTGTAPFVVSSTTEVVNLHADTATTLHTARAISLGGDLSGSASFDGSSDITITASVEPNSVALGTDTTGNYMVGLAEGTGITITHTPGEGSTASVSLNATLDDLTDVSVAAPTDGYFLKYVSASSAWVPAAIPTINNLDDVGDVTITSASAGQFLQWNGSAWVNALPSSTTVADSAPASPSEGDIWFDSTTLDTFIRYDSAWLQINAEPSIEDLNDLFDVNVQNPQPNDFLKYDGTEWVASSSIIPVAITTKTVNYTLTVLDANKLIEMNSDSANTLTIPTNATVALPVGTRVEVVQRGAGKTEIAGAAGVTIRSYIGTYIAGQYGCATLIKRANNEWYVFGDLSAT